jgi:Fe-S cluster assembly protein SufD
MSDPKVANTIARERVDGLAKSNAEPQWLKTSRLTAWEAYLQMPMPTARDEDWRKTEIDSLDLSTFVAVGPIEAREKSAPKVADHALLSGCSKAVEKTAGIFVEDYQAQNLSVSIDAEVAKKGVIFASWQEALEKHGELVEKYLTTPAQNAKADVKANTEGETIVKAEDDKFTLMNRALFTGGYFLYVPANVEIDAPFLALTNLTGEKVEAHGQAFIERIVVVAGDNAKLNLFTIFSSPEGDSAAQGALKSQASSLANIFVEAHVGRGARVNVVELSQLGHNVFAISRTSTYVGRDGHLDYTTASLGARQIKSVIETLMIDRGGNSDVKGIILGDLHEHVSFNTIQQHASPDTTSNINFRVALKDEASSIYQGIVKVDKVAQRTNAFQSNKNLLLGSGARADSIPRLEILADDVKCSHGATVGPVDKDQLFYLNSRGLPMKEAEELIVIGFFAEVLNTISIKGAADWIGSLIAEKIHQ